MTEDAEKNTQVRGIQAESSTSPNSDGGQTIGRRSSTRGGKSKRISRTDSKNSGYRQILGKILRQLRILQDAHLAYVTAHRERLESRLAENLAHTDQLTQQIRELDQEITQLLDGEASKPSGED